MVLFVDAHMHPSFLKPIFFLELPKGDRTLGHRGQLLLGPAMFAEDDSRRTKKSGEKIISDGNR